MNISIKYNPSYAMAAVMLDSGESIRAEGGSLVSMTPNIGISTQRSTAGRGGIIKSMKTAFLGGESFWMNTFTAGGGKGEVLLAPTLPGDIKVIQVDGSIFVQSSSYLAGSPAFSIDTKFQGMKGFFTGESLFFLKISGRGQLLISSFGGIEEISVHDSILIDTGHIVAFEETLSYEIRKAGGWKSFFFGGEGLVCNFRGTGRIWIQSRNVPALARWLSQKLPPKKK